MRLLPPATGCGLDRCLIYVLTHSVA